MAEFRPLVPPSEQNGADHFTPYRTAESVFVRLGEDPPDPASRPTPTPTVTPTGHAPALSETPRPPVQDVAAMLIEAEARGRALAQAELQSMRREVETIRVALEQEKKDVHKVLEGIQSVEETMKGEFRFMFGQIVLAATKRLVTADAAKEAVFRTRLDTVAEQLVMEKEVILRVPTRFGTLARSIVADRAGWTVSEDPALQTGCVAECRSGAVDGSIAAAMRGLDAAVKEWLSQGGEVRAR